MRSDGRARMASAGFVGGLAVGFVLWSVEQRAHRRDLFSPHALRRFAALGYLGGRPGSDTARLLRDYVRWETHPTLRRRARLLLQRVERYLD